MKLISERHRIEGTVYSLDFQWIDAPSAGFTFECDPQGNVDREALSPAARENLDMCLAMSGRNGTIRALGVQSRLVSHVQPAIGECCCGREVMLTSFTNTCDCGRDYNRSGDLLAPREQWGEETGEHWTDII